MAQPPRNDLLFYRHPEPKAKDLTSVDEQELSGLVKIFRRLLT